MCRVLPTPKGTVGIVIGAREAQGFVAKWQGAQAAWIGDPLHPAPSAGRDPDLEQD